MLLYMMNIFYNIQFILYNFGSSKIDYFINFLYASLIILLNSNITSKTKNRKQILNVDYIFK